jgi:hypothetical protein
MDMVAAGAKYQSNKNRRKKSLREKSEGRRRRN